MQFFTLTCTHYLILIVRTAHGSQLILCLLISILFGTHLLTLYHNPFRFRRQQSRQGRSICPYNISRQSGISNNQCSPFADSLSQFRIQPSGSLTQCRQLTVQVRTKQAQSAGRSIQPFLNFRLSLAATSNLLLDRLQHFRYSFGIRMLPCTTYRTRFSRFQRGTHMLGTPAACQLPRLLQSGQQTVYLFTFRCQYLHLTHCGIQFLGNLFRRKPIFRQTLPAFHYRRLQLFQSLQVGITFRHVRHPLLQCLYIHTSQCLCFLPDTLPTQNQFLIRFLQTILFFPAYQLLIFQLDTVFLPVFRLFLPTLYSLIKRLQPVRNRILVFQHITVWHQFRQHPFRFRLPLLQLRCLKLIFRLLLSQQFFLLRQQTFLLFQASHGSLLCVQLHLLLTGCRHQRKHLLLFLTEYIVIFFYI